MWSSWRRSSPRVHSTQSNTLTKSSNNFRCSSFKDIQTLCDDETTSSTTSTSHPTFNGNHQHNQLLLRQHQPLQKLPPPPSAKKIFHRVRVASSLLRNWPTTNTTKPQQQPCQQKHPQEYESEKSNPQPEISIRGADNRIVIYTTSLRVIRQTFDACRDVKLIFSGFRVPIDERDLSMDSGFLDELRSIIHGGDCSVSDNNKNLDKPLRLPRVFIGGRYVGGAEEVRQMHEVGDLKKLIEGLPPATTRTPRICGACGGYRFVLCGACDGSHKVYSEKGGGGFRSCEACNRNGLARCPSCNPTALVVR